MNAAAVVVRWKGGDEIDRCLRSLLSQTGDQLGRVVVVDSGSGDDGAERLAAAFPDVEVVALAENLSFAHAANTGVATISDDLVFLLNPDTELEDGVVSTLVGALELRPRAVGVTPLLVNPDGSAQHRWQLRRLPTTARLALGRPGAPAFSSPPTTATTVAQPAAAAWMVRREVWLALGGLDAAFVPAWWEDVDFCARLATRLGEPGFPADEGFVVIPEARVRHQGGSSLQQLDEAAFVTAWTGNLVRYAVRHHPDHLGVIRAGLRWSLIGRALLHPHRASAYLHAQSAVGRRRYL
jgi:GT2 family glycosyltransferase